ncbi:MAG TPA: folate-binding protein [Methylotenera sp.]|nr:folate-binding protein [Methylotenera sp.]
MQEWHQFLQSSSNAVIEDSKVIHFVDPTGKLHASKDTIICDLSHLGLLELDGADAFTFLQGQVTNDIKQLSGNNAHYTGYCNPKGRLLALFLAFSHYNHIHLQMPKELVESIAKRLRMYVMRSKVVITDVSESIIKIGLCGNDAATLLSTLFPAVPLTDYELANSENGALIKLPGKAPRYEIFTNPSYAKVVWNALKEHAKPVGALAWELLEIQVGIPDVILKTQEEFVPQMLNLDALNAINYKKGCYTGQEIVARTHYLGKVKRRTQLAHLDTAAAPLVGDDITDTNKQTIGKIVRSAQAIEGGYDVLAESRLENIEEGIYWNGLKLSIKPLPYPLDEA